MPRTAGSPGHGTSSEKAAQVVGKPRPSDHLALNSPGSFFTETPAWLIWVNEFTMGCQVELMPSRNGHTRNSYVTARDPNAVYKSKAVPDGSKGGWGGRCDGHSGGRTERRLRLFLMGRDSERSKASRGQESSCISME